MSSDVMVGSGCKRNVKVNVNISKGRKQFVQLTACVHHRGQGVSSSICPCDEMVLLLAYTFLCCPSLSCP